MTDKEMLKAISSAMDEKLEPIKDTLEQQTELLQENRDALNALLSWADKVSQMPNMPNLTA